jgi:glucose/arabinose dehydrogenase
VVRVDVENGRPVGEWRPFIRGWLTGPSRALGYGVGRAWGRPVDLLVTPDGALLVSDDEGHRIYRIAYRGQN